MIVPRTQPSASSDQTNPGPQPGLADMLMAAAIQAKFAKQMGGQDQLPQKFSDVKNLKDIEGEMELKTEGPDKIHAEGPGEGVEPHARYLLNKKERGI